MALTYTPKAELGSAMPSFTLPSVAGGKVSSQDFISCKATLVMFICNHCPYVQAIEDRLLTLGKKWPAKEVGIVAICSNDAKDHPEDSFAGLKKRWQEKNYPFPYLHDESQDVARAFGAVCTPDFFLYDRKQKLFYRGRLDDSWKNPQLVQQKELEFAIAAILAGKASPTPQVPSMGCSIKWFEK